MKTQALARLRLEVRDYPNTEQADVSIAPSHKGRLHKYLGVPEGQKIPVSLIKEKLKTSKNAHVRKMLNYALNARKWKKG
jgi:hypothetical protein